MTYTNFLSGQLSARGTIGQKAWNWAIDQGYSPEQTKVAVQQLHNWGGIQKNPFFSGASNPMKGVAGWKSPNNPMGQYQGPGGNMGLTSYMTARHDGFSPEQIAAGAAQGGMILPHRAQTQYDMEMAAQGERDQMLNYMKQLEAMMNRPQPKVGRSAPYAVGTGGAAGLAAAATDKKSSRDKWKGTQKWRREAFAAAMNTQTGSGGGVAATGGAGGSLNMAK